MARMVVGLLLAALLAGCANSVSFTSARRFAAADAAPVRVRADLSLPQGQGPFPAVVLLHAAGGARPHVTRDWPAALNAQGVAALTVYSCDSSDSNVCIASRGQWMSRMSEDATGALDFLAARPDIDPRAISVMGFSAGAFAAEGLAGMAAPSPSGHRFRSAISVYGNCSVPGAPAMPVLAIMGALDRNASQCPLLPPQVQVLLLPGATHAFDQSDITTLTTVAGGYPAVYHRAATQQAQRAVAAFVEQHRAR
jgi:dienelactone hydrolase